MSTHPQTFGCSVFWKDEATSQKKKKRCQKPPERITIEYIKVILCFPRGAVNPFQSFPRVWDPCAPPCLDATPWVMKQELRKVDLAPCMALPLQFHMYHFMPSSFCFRSPPKRRQKRPSLQGFTKGLEELQIRPCHQICCHHCRGHHPPGTTAPTQRASRALGLCSCHCSSWNMAPCTPSIAALSPTISVSLC